MNFRILKTLLLSILMAALILPSLILANNDLEEKCRLLIETGPGKLNTDEYRKVLEECEKYYREESARIEADLSKTEQEKKTLQSKIYSLSQKIKNLTYQIYQSNLIIKDLGFQIGDTEASISKTSLKIEDSQEKLSNILRNIYEENQKSMVEILLSENNLSDFFDNLMALEILNSKSKELLQHIKVLKTSLEQQKQALDEEKGELEEMVKIQTLQKEESDKTKKEQEYYLRLTESEYQKYLKEKEQTEKKAAEIRTRIFELIGVPKAPTFGEAYEIAKYVETITGVRPAFLLAVLQQESAIGRNVGQCYLVNSATGEGLKVNTEQKMLRTMNPTRDVPPFLIITKELNRDPYQTLVSCPMSYGWGGAMGPAQFIPSTWMLYRDRLKSITGRPADPWNISDAFLAAGLYLSDYGAANKTRNGEWRAAMIYFSGSTNPQYSWYGNNVLKIADGFAKDIAILEKK